MAKIKKQRNIFTTPQDLKEWSMDLVEACGSIITNKKPNVSKIDTLVEKFVIDYNYNIEKIYSKRKKEDKKGKILAQAQANSAMRRRGPRLPTCSAGWGNARTRD